MSVGRFYSDLNSSYEPALYSGLLYLTCVSSIQLVLVHPPSCNKTKYVNRKVCKETIRGLPLIGREKFP